MSIYNWVKYSWRSNIEVERVVTSEFTVYFNEASYVYLCCNSEAVNYVLKSLVNDEKDDILSIVMYKY